MTSVPSNLCDALPLLSNKRKHLEIPFVDSKKEEIKSIFMDG
ncbi:MAG: hypothetical protein WCB31_08665 [Nitrososphaeraceae archaeon]